MKDTYQITKLPELTADNLEKVMSERISATKNSNTVIPMLWQGLLELPVLVNGQERTAKYYISQDTPQGTALVILNVPEGKQTIPFLKESGWMDKADAEHFCLFVAEPAADKWGTPEEEEPYLKATVSAAKLGRYILAAFSPYIVGYGAIGVILHKIAMEDPLHTAAAAFLDAGSVEDAYRREYETKSYIIPDPYNPAAETLCAPYRNIPIPVWFASETIDARTETMIGYWMNAEKAGEPQKDEIYGTVYPQNDETEYTPEGSILKVAVQEKSYDYASPATTDAIYNFLKQYYRYGMGPLSNMISLRSEAEDIGAEHRHFTDSNGIDREYLVYVPKAYRDGDKKRPMVLAYHGASQSMRNMMANGMWYKLADQEGIIIVYPESGLTPMHNELSYGIAFAYRPLWAFFDEDVAYTDKAYANELMDRVIAEFPVDESRIYVTGHSMGCMMTNFLGSTNLSDRFAAVGATSGRLQIREHTGTNPLPAFMTVGQFELWNYLISQDNPVTAQIDMWLVRNGFATEETVRDVRMNRATEIYKEGRYKNYVWKDADGTPWVRYAWVSMKHHVHTYDESCTFWNQWFSRWHIGADGKRHYE